MIITVKYFASIAEATGTDTAAFENLTSIAELKAHIFEIHPSLKKMTFAVAHNQEIKKDDFTIEDGDELAFLPPFAGG